MKNILVLLSLVFSSSLSAAMSSLPVVIAHRGASGYVPEHTLEAKTMAYAYGADYLEQDLVLSKDNVPVLLHDIHIDTTTDVAQVFPDRKREDGRYYALDFTVAELKQLRATERFDAKTGKQALPGRFPIWQSIFRITTLEEELQLIQGLNKSTGRNVGIYPEFKAPKWHREQGRDLSRVILPILERHGYKTKADLCWVQCSEYDEVLRIRNELGWNGRLLLLLNARARTADGTPFSKVRDAEPFRKLAATIDGVGPALSLIVTWDQKQNAKVSDFTKNARAAGLTVHPYTVRSDELPKNCPSVDALHEAIFRDAGIDGVFTDFVDTTVRWLRQNSLRGK